jgi:hypothetical protein
MRTLPSSSLTVPDVQISRFRFFMEELCPRGCNDGRSGLPAEGGAVRVQRPVFGPISFTLAPTRGDYGHAVRGATTCPDLGRICARLRSAGISGSRKFWWWRRRSFARVELTGTSWLRQTRRGRNPAPLFLWPITPARPPHRRACGDGDLFRSLRSFAWFASPFSYCLRKALLKIHDGHARSDR